jgi:hypothetical protein
MLYPIELRVRKDRQANAKVREVKETASRETMVRDWYLWARLLHHYFISASCFSVSSMAQTRRMGKRNRRADRTKAPRFSPYHCRQDHADRSLRHLPFPCVAAPPDAHGVAAGPLPKETGSAPLTSHLSPLT